MVSIERGTISFTIRVLDSEWSVYDVVAYGVTDLHIQNLVEVPWTYADVTEFELVETDTGETIEIVLWDEPTGISVHCLRVTIDKRAV